METKIAEFLIAYIKKVVKDETYDVFDVKTSFGSYPKYAAFYILPAKQLSSFSSLEKEELNQDKTLKTFTYKDTLEVLVRVDFHGSDCETQMKLFRDSFYQDAFNEIFKNSDFSFKGFFSMPQNKNIVEAENTEFSMTSTIKLQVIEKIEDSSTMVKNLKIKISIVKEI